MVMRSRRVRWGLVALALVGCGESNGSSNPGVGSGGSVGMAGQADSAGTAGAQSDSGGSETVAGGAGIAGDTVDGGSGGTSSAINAGTGSTSLGGTAGSAQGGGSDAGSSGMTGTGGTVSEAGSSGMTSTGGTVSEAGSSGMTSTGGTPPLADCNGSANGVSQTRVRYAVASGANSVECAPEAQFRTCQDGTWSSWSGTSTFEQCTVMGCPALPETRLRFAQAQVDYPAVCIPETQYRDCTGGVSGPWIGSYTFETCNVKTKSCGTTPHLGTETATRYRAAHVPFGGQCESEQQTRLCINGDFLPWSGSFTADGCDVTPAAKCDGSTHGAIEERVRFDHALVRSWSDCHPEAQTRTCSNGTWSSWTGSPSFDQLSCRVELEGWCSEDAQCKDGPCAGNFCRCPAHQQMASCAGKSCCECAGAWQGDDCEICRGNYDPAQDCAKCRNHWSGNDCQRCPAQFTAASDCQACSPGWSGPNCETQDVCVRYVDLNSKAPVETGYSWSEAFSSIGLAKYSVRSQNCQLWLREGTYPGAENPAANEAWFGGFAGTEKSLSERNPEAHETIFAGTLNGSGTVDSVKIWGEVTAPFMTESLTIRHAKFLGRNATIIAYGPVLVEDSVFDGVRRVVYANVQGDVTLRRTRISASTTAALVVGGTAVRFEDSAIVDNFPYEALFDVQSGQLELVNTLVTGNETTANFGSIFSVLDGDLRVMSSTIANNVVRTGKPVGTRFYVAPQANAAFVNTILWGNAAPQISKAGHVVLTHTIVEGGYEGEGNVSSAPSFVNFGSHPYRLSAGSVGIDAADGDAAPDHDLAGGVRVDKAATANTGTGTPNYADIGAYETP
jgi:hypothetical protein